MPKNTDDDAYDDPQLQTFSKLHFNDICCASANQEGRLIPPKMVSTVLTWHLLSFTADEAILFNQIWLFENI